MCGDTTHTHDKQETGINEANQLVCGMRKRAREGLTPLPQIYEEERGNTITTDLGASPAEVACKLPFFSSIKTQLYRQRHFLIPQSAKDVNDIILNDEWSQTESGEHFILIDDISEGSRIIVFGTDDSLHRLCASDIASIDGTFKVCPRVFYQLYDIHSHMYGTVLPELFCLLPDKKAATYHRLLSLLITKCAEREYCLKPATIIVDFDWLSTMLCEHYFPHLLSRVVYFILGWHCGGSFRSWVLPLSTARKTMGSAVVSTVHWNRICPATTSYDGLSTDHKHIHT